MKTLFRVILISITIFIASGLYLSGTKPSLAQEPVGELTPTPEITPAGELSLTSELTPTAETRFRDITWADLDYSDRKLSPNRSVARFTFNVPGDLVFVPGSFVNLIVSHTGAQVEKPAALTINLNGHVLDTAQLTEENDSRSQIQLDILPEQLKTGSNDLSVNLAAGGNPCLSDELPVSAILHSEGLLHLAYEVVPREPELALYPAPFFERGFDPSVVYFVLPDSPTPDDMAVAATISAGLGRYSRGEIQVSSVTPSELTAEIQDNYNLIVIGRPEANTFLSKIPLPLSLAGANVTAGQGILQEIESPWNPRRMVLAVTGRTNEGMFKAGAALNRQILFPSFRGQVVIVEALLDPPSNEVEQPGTDIIFEELGYNDKVIYGARPTSQRFNFFMPGDWQMSDDPSLMLHFTHSEVLSNAISTLDVHLNGIPVGSALLDHSNSQDGLLDIEFPGWLLKSGANSIEVFVDMAIAGGDECLDASSHQAWTVINRYSSLHLSYETQATELDLASLYQPLTNEPNLNDTYLALSETLTQSEREALLNLAVRLGAAARGGYLALQAGWADDLSLDIKQTHHLVTIGQPSLNSLIRDREVNDVLPQPFLPGSNEPSQIHNPAIIVFDPQRSIGFVQLLVSPWNPDKALLVVTGTNDEGLIAASDLLINRMRELKGNLAIIEAEELVTIDTRPLQVNQSDDKLHVVRPDTAALVARAERWW